MPDTPSQELRQAAKLMRERAEAATPGAWKHMCLGSEGCLVIRDSGTIRERGHGRVARFGCKEWHPDHADAEYVAAMDPLVALALADWLDNEAHAAEAIPSTSPALGLLIRHALAVARAYLGSES